MGQGEEKGREMAGNGRGTEVGKGNGNGLERERGRVSEGEGGEGVKERVEEIVGEGDGKDMRGIFAPPRSLAPTPHGNARC